MLLSAPRIQHMFLRMNRKSKMLLCYVISNLEITGILEDFVRCYDPLQKTRMGYDEKNCYYTRHFETAFTEKTALWKISSERRSNNIRD